MATIYVKLSSSQVSDLTAVSNIGAVTIDEVVRSLENSKATISEKTVFEVFKRHMTEGEAEALRNITFGISTLANRDFNEIPEAVASVSRTLQKNHEDKYELFAACADSLTRLLQTDSVFFTAKAINISYDFERVLIGSRILTSIRPIFNRDKAKIVGTTVVQTLRLEYFGSNGEKNSLSIALDIDDMRSLQKSCADGLNKARLAKESIKTDWGIDSFTPGEDIE